MNPQWKLKAEFQALPWRGESAACIEYGVICSYCDAPIGLDQNDRLWELHKADCNECPICETPFLIFKERCQEFPNGAFKPFHFACFEKLLEK